MTKTYVPDAGDIVWLKFDPQAGHEQAGHRPALVLTPASYNGKAPPSAVADVKRKVIALLGRH